MRFFNEWDERLVTGTVTENADGSVEVYLNAQTYMSLWMALTTVYPESEIDVWEYEDYDNGDDWYNSYDRFTVKYGTKTQTGISSTPCSFKPIVRMSSIDTP